MGEKNLQETIAGMLNLFKNTEEIRKTLGLIIYGAQARWCMAALTKMD